VPCRCKRVTQLLVVVYELRKTMAFLRCCTSPRCCRGLLQLLKLPTHCSATIHPRFSQGLLECSHSPHSSTTLELTIFRNRFFASLPIIATIDLCCITVSHCIPLCFPSLFLCWLLESVPMPRTTRYVDVLLCCVVPP
jgi:hypothetical protein